MNERHKASAWQSGIVAGAVGAATAILKKKNVVKAKLQRAPENPGNVWARPGMTVVIFARN